MNIHGYKQKIKKENKKEFPNQKRIYMWRNCIKKLREKKLRGKKKT